MEGVTMLRQLIGQIQEFWELYGSYPLNQRLCLLDVDNSITVEHSYLDFIQGGKLGPLKMVDDNKPPPAKKFRRDKSHEKRQAFCSSTEIMEQSIWKEFPEDLFEAVIARVPVTAFFRFRSVCSKWNSLLTSSSFSKYYAKILQFQNPWFYTITHENINSGAMYDPSLNKWHQPSVPSLPSKTIVLPVASAGGLICFLDIGHRNFYVGNPLTNAFKELPRRSVHVWARVAVGMVINGLTYKVMWLGSNGDHEVYDSDQNSWVQPGVLPLSIKLPLSLNLRSHTVSIGTTVYFMRADPDGILSYDMVSGVWKELIIPPPPLLMDRTLAESGGRLLLVGLLTNNAATCVGVWELQRMTLLWKEVDRMPNIWCLEFYGKHVWMTCLGNQGLLMLSLRSRRTNRLVTYDVGKKEWRKVPDCVLPRGRKRQWIACGMAFHPCPTALA